MDVLKIVGLIISVVTFIFVNRLWINDVDKALFTRIERVNYLLAELLIGGLISFSLFIIVFSGENSTMSWLMFSDENSTMSSLILISTVFSIMSITLGIILFIVIEKLFLKRKVIYFFYDESNCKKYYIINRLTNNEVVISESYEDGVRYIKGISDFYGMPIIKRKYKKTNK